MISKNIMNEFLIMNKRKLYLLLLTCLITILTINMVNTVNAVTNSDDFKYSNGKHDSSLNYTISYFDKTVGGDVLKNPRISKNIPNTTLSQKIIKMTNKGSVILKFGKSNPKILVCAGIHGNESAANIATLKLIESLKNKKIKGSIYIIPFVIPGSTAINSRYWYKDNKKYDPNRITNIPGSPGYKIIKFARKNKINYIIEVHSGGFISHYKRGFIYANKYPTNKKEAQWIKYIKKTVNPKINYTNIPPKGYFRAYARANRISAISFEVERDIGTISHWADVELKMLHYGLKYFKLY